MIHISSNLLKFGFIMKITRIRTLYFIGLWKTLSYLRKAWFMWNIEAGVKNICVLFVIIYCGKLPWENLLLLYIGDITYLSLSGCFIINTFFVIRKKQKFNCKQTQYGWHMYCYIYWCNLIGLMHSLNLSFLVFFEK